MGDRGLDENERKLLRLLHVVAEPKARELGISTIDYLVGILGGNLPIITLEDLHKAKRRQKKKPKRAGKRPATERSRKNRRKH